MEFSFLNGNNFTKRSYEVLNYAEGKEECRRSKSPNKKEGSALTLPHTAMY